MISSGLLLRKKEEQIFLGREFAQHRDYSEETARLIDDEIRAIVTQGYERAKEIIQTNMAILHKLANALLEKEVLDGHQIDSHYKGEEQPFHIAFSNPSTIEALPLGSKMNLIRCLHITDFQRPSIK